MNNITPADATRPGAALHLLEAADFHPHRGQEFTILFAGEIAATATLEKVVELTGYTTLERKPFSLLFQTGLQTTFYRQAIYTVTHPALGSLDIFLVPSGPTEKGMQYEAVFS